MAKDIKKEKKELLPRGGVTKRIGPTGEELPLEWERPAWAGPELEGPEAEGVFIGKETGKPSGITIGGKTYFGLRPKDVESILGKAGISPEEAVPIGEATEEARLKAAAPEQLEAAGAFEQVTPGRVELSPERTTPLEKLPVLGPIIGGIGSALLPQKFETTEGLGFDMPITPETVREAGLRQIRDASFQEGLSFSEGFGTVIEGIPVVGALARKYAGNLIETPSSNADNVVDEINKVKEAASTGQEKVRNGLEDPDYGLDRARSMEEQVAQLEGRLKTLINSSPILRANTDEVNRIEEGILEAREKIARYRQASAFGLTASLTGTGRVIPTDEQMFFALQEGRT